jgi:transposase
MAKRTRYAPEFRAQMVELVRAGRTPEELAKEFPPSARRSGTGSAKPRPLKGGERTG